MKFGQGAVSGVSEWVIDYFGVWYVEIEAHRLSRWVEVFEDFQESPRFTHPKTCVCVIIWRKVTVFYWGANALVTVVLRELLERPYIHHEVIRGFSWSKSCWFVCENDGGWFLVHLLCTNGEIILWSRALEIINTFWCRAADIGSGIPSGPILSGNILFNCW